MIKNVLSGALSLLKGMWVTFINLIRKPITMQYPDEKWEIPAGYRGRHKLSLDKDCIACGLCAKACPNNCIILETFVGEDKKRKLKKYEIDIGKCLFCGLCVEACPTDVLKMGDEYELATEDKKQLILDKEKLQK